MLNLSGLLLLTYTAAVADTALAPVLDVYHVAPSLLALLAIAWVVTAAASPWRVVQCAAIGLVFDFNGGGHAGIGMAGFAVAGFVLLHFRPAMRRLDPVGQALVTAALVAALLLVVGLGNLLFGQALPALPVALFRGLAAGAYTGAVSLPVWMILDWLRASRRPRLGTSLL